MAALVCVLWVGARRVCRECLRRQSNDIVVRQGEGSRAGELYQLPLMEPGRELLVPHGQGVDGGRRDADNREAPAVTRPAGSGMRGTSRRVPHNDTLTMHC